MYILLFAGAHYSYVKKKGNINIHIVSMILILYYKFKINGTYINFYIWKIIMYFIVNNELIYDSLWWYSNIYYIKLILYQLIFHNLIILIFYSNFFFIIKTIKTNKHIMIFLEHYEINLSILFLLYHIFYYYPYNY